MFMRSAAHVRADGVGGEILGGAMKPASQHISSGQIPGIPGQNHEDGLRDILRRVLIANHASRGGIDEIDVSPLQLGKRRLRPVFGVRLEQDTVGGIIHFTKE